MGPEDTTALVLDLAETVRLYCGYSPSRTEDAIFLECIAVLNFNWSFLTGPEIPFAFRLVGTGALGAIDLTAYAGRFTVLMFTELFTAYANRNRIITGEILRTIETVSREKSEDSERDAKNQETYAKWENDFHEAVVAGGSVLPIWKEWQQIPGFLADYICRHTALAEIPVERKQEIYKQAQEIVKQRLRTDANNPLKSNIEIRKAREILADFDNQKLGQVDLIYAKLRLWELAKPTIPEAVK